MTDNLQPIHQIRTFKSREEEAAFWDTHDVADLMERGEHVQVKFTPKDRLISVRFDRQAADRLRRQAHKRGLKPTTLIRMWVLEKLDQPSSKNDFNHSW